MCGHFRPFYGSLATKSVGYELQTPYTIFEGDLRENHSIFAAAVGSVYGKSHKKEPMLHNFRSCLCCLRHCYCRFSRLRAHLADVGLIHTSPPLSTSTSTTEAMTMASLFPL